jgi:hypothetical protein
MHRNWVHLIAEFHQLCCRQLALIIESLHAIFIQIRLNRDLEGREQLQGELISLVDIIDVMKNVNNNYFNNN